MCISKNQGKYCVYYQRDTGYCSSLSLEGHWLLWDYFRRGCVCKYVGGRDSGLVSHTQILNRGCVFMYIGGCLVHKEVIKISKLKESDCIVYMYDEIYSKEYLLMRQTF